MIIGIGNDHAAVELKKAMMEHVTSMGHECIDYGAQEGEKMDYPVPGRAVAEAIVRGEIDKGILICGTGIGISITANKVPGIRAAACSEPFTARLCVEHNNCQIIAFGSRVIGEGTAKDIVDAFLHAEFEGGRHARRVELIGAVDEMYRRDAESADTDDGGQA
ncbi:MAG: ribose 5-phosphate isomerase B [Lachnospiraceae bacterium]|nr:ribose 5-phosphate isomerase B [Lachnospiraceae bacterium]